MKTRSTISQNQKCLEISGIGSAPEEDGFVLKSGEEIKELRSKGSFFKKLFSGPYELSGTGSNTEESDFVIQEMAERGMWK